MLHAQLYDRTFGLGRSIPDNVTPSLKCADAINNMLYSHDPLSVVSAMHFDFLLLMPTRRGLSESF